MGSFLNAMGGRRILRRFLHFFNANKLCDFNKYYSLK